MRPQKTGRIHKKLKKRKPKGTISRAIASVCLTFAIAGLFGVVGYSVAKPLLRNWEATEEDSTASISMESSAQQYRRKRLLNRQRLRRKRNL